MELAKRATSTSLASFPLLERVDLLRRKASGALDLGRQTELGQYFTPAPVARLMASMFVAADADISILDPGAGVGSLSAALVEELALREHKPERIRLTAVELDQGLIPYLADTLAACREFCSENGIEFEADLRCEDFIGAQVGGLFPDMREFNCAIANPPYRKIGAESKSRRLLSSAGFETSNLYAGFLSLVVRALAPGGELVAITPRSFCNGPYFRTFRRYLLSTMRLERLHVFDSREAAFSEEQVLQENMILHAVKSEAAPEAVVVTSSAGPEDEGLKQRIVDYDKIVMPGDPGRVIHLVTDEVGEWVGQAVSAFHCTLADLELGVSTGRVVEFRARHYLSSEPAEGCVPLIYPSHFSNGFVRWPDEGGRRPNAIRRDPRTEELLVPSGYYVLLRRFSAKEEPRRIVAAVCDPTRLPSGPLAFENHLNFIHRNGSGLDEALAKGLTLFLNSRLVDLYFRLFSGHTQVNAADLRRMVFPSVDELRSLGRMMGQAQPDQERIDNIMEKEFPQMAEATNGVHPVQVQQRVEEATAVLKALGLPKRQQNERSALTLLALLDLKPDEEWGTARSPLRGVTEMMEWIASHYGKTYRPNTRESVRKETLHQFVQAALVLINPDDPERRTNSPNTVYTIEAKALDVIHVFRTPRWQTAVESYLREVPELRRRYEQQREMARVPLRFGGVELSLSPGEHSELVREVIEEMCSRFTPGAKPLYVSDTQNKLAHLDRGMFAELGVSVEEHGKLPDVVVYDISRNWLMLVEAVTSQGPVSPKRHQELKELFAGCGAGLVFVTAFPDRQTMVRHLSEISWETEVWLAESPGHMIHFNGERFLGPYDLKG